MSAEGTVETKTEGADAGADAQADGVAEAQAEGVAEGGAEGVAEGGAEGVADGGAEGVADGGAIGTDTGNPQDVKRKKFRPLKSIRKILGIKKGRKKALEDPTLVSAKPVSKSTGALLQVVETENDEDISNKTSLANRSMSADSVFTPANVQVDPLRKGDMAASVDNLPTQNFQSELSAKLKSRQSEDGTSSEDECLPRSPDTIVTMGDVINEHSNQNGMKRHSEESLESVGDEPGIAMVPDQLGQGEKHPATLGTSVPAQLVNSGDVDLDAIPASPTHLSNQAALHKLSIAPKLRKASSRSRGVGKSPNGPPNLPVMTENHRTADSPDLTETPADTDPPPKPPRTDAFIPTLTPTKEEGPLEEEQVVKFTPPREMPVVSSYPNSFPKSLPNFGIDQDSLGVLPPASPVQNEDGDVMEETGEEEEGGDSGTSSSGAAGSADMAADEDTGEAIAQRLLAVVAQQELTGGDEEPSTSSPPPHPADQVSPGVDSQEAPEDPALVTPKSPTRGPQDPLEMQLVEEMKQKQAEEKHESFEQDELPPEEEPEMEVSVEADEEEPAAPEAEVPTPEEQGPDAAAADLPAETIQQEHQHAMYVDSHDPLQEDSQEGEKEEEPEEKVEDEPQEDLRGHPKETAPSEEDEDEPPPAEEEELEKEVADQNGPVEDEATPPEEELEEEKSVVAEPKDEPAEAKPKRLSVAETRQMFARSEPPLTETETVIKPKPKAVSPKSEPDPSLPKPVLDASPTKPVSTIPKTGTTRETIVVKKPTSNPVVPKSPSGSASPQLRALADKPQPKKVFGSIKALEEQGENSVPAWVRIAQKKQKEREGKDDDTVGGKKVVVVEKTPPASSPVQSPPASPARKPSATAVPPKVLVVEKTGSVTARPAAPRPSVVSPKPFSMPPEPPTPVIVPASKAEEPTKPARAQAKPAESKPAGGNQSPPTTSPDLKANNKINKAGQYLTRQQKKNFILPKPEKCIVCKENVYQTEMVKSDGCAFHKKCQRCLVCKRTLDISSFMVIQEKIYCKQHGQDIKLAQQAS